MLKITLDYFVTIVPRNDGIGGCFAKFTSLRDNRKIVVAIQKKDKNLVSLPNSHAEQHEQCAKRSEGTIDASA